MISLTDKDIGEFQEIWKQETGQEISAETAREYAQNILGLIESVIHHHPREEEPP